MDFYRRNEFYRTSLPGNRLEKLPKLVQPLAIFLRNALRITIAPKKHSDVHAEVRKRLSFGVQYVCESDVEGDIAEFGTAAGTTATAIAWAMSEFDHAQNGPKNLHLFDSFRGLPKAESRVDTGSFHVKSGVWGEGTCYSLTKEELVGVCAVSLPIERILVYEGWFKDTLPQIPEGTKFAMLHIDSDLYQSAIEVLAYCFSHNMVQEGTVIFFDDWNSNRASPELGERRAWHEIVARFSVNYSDCGEYGYGGRKFIVHSYESITS